jgi:hypothetical protein
MITGHPRSYAKPSAPRVAQLNEAEKLNRRDWFSIFRQHRGFTFHLSAFAQFCVREFAPSLIAWLFEDHAPKTAIPTIHQRAVFDDSLGLSAPSDGVSVPNTLGSSSERGHALGKNERSSHPRK